MLNNLLIESITCRILGDSTFLSFTYWTGEFSVSAEKVNGGYI